MRIARGYGYADLASRRRVTADTMFHLASITKTVTATAILQLADAGKLDLDAPVAAHLDFPLANPHHPDAPITARQLLNHTSSLSDARYYEIDFRVKGRDAVQPLGDLLKSYLVPGGATWSAEGCFSAAAPGAAWDYCNIGYTLLGYLAGRLGGEDLRARTARTIFAPLAMKHTSWTLAGTPQALRETPYDMVDDVRTAVEPVGSPDWPGSMIHASITDVTAFAAASANGGQARGARILWTCASAAPPARSPTSPAAQPSRPASAARIGRRPTSPRSWGARCSCGSRSRTGGSGHPSPGKPRCSSPTSAPPGCRPAAPASPRSVPGAGSEGRHGSRASRCDSARPTARSARWGPYRPWPG